MMNPFADATCIGGPGLAFAEHLRNGSRLQQLQHRRGDGRLSSSSGEVDVDNRNGKGGLSPSVSAMAAVSIRSNSGPPVPSAARSSFGSGSFLVPGALAVSASRSRSHVGMNALAEMTRLKHSHVCGMVWLYS